MRSDALEKWLCMCYYSTIKKIQILASQNEKLLKIMLFKEETFYCILMWENSSGAPRCEFRRWKPPIFGTLKIT